MDTVDWVCCSQAAIQEKMNASQRNETKPSGDAEVSQAAFCFLFDEKPVRGGVNFKHV